MPQTFTEFICRRVTADNADHAGGCAEGSNVSQHIGRAAQPRRFTLDVNDGHGRFADAGNHYTYRFELPADVTGGKLTIDIGAEYLVRVSSDNQTWREIARQTERITDRSNQGELPPFDLADLLRGSHTLYLRFDDSFPDDGWGAWLAHVKLELQRSG